MSIQLGEDGVRGGVGSHAPQWSHQPLHHEQQVSKSSSWPGGKEDMGGRLYISVRLVFIKLN